MGISFQSDLQGVSPTEIAGEFFEGWPAPLSPEDHLKVLEHSDLVGLAIERSSGQVVGYVNALTDGRQSAFIPLLAVLENYRGNGIGTALVQDILDRLGRLNDGRGVNVDLSCDEDLVPFYERFGMRPGRAMWLRSHRQKR